MTVLMPAGGGVARTLIDHEPPMPFEPRAEDFDLTAGLRLVRRRLVMIIAVSALLTLAAVPLIAQMKPVYHAASRLMIHGPQAPALDAADPGPEALNIVSETERLLSRPIAERVIEDMRLADRAEFNPALRPASPLDEARAMLRGLIDGERPAAAAAEGIERIIPEYYGALDVRREAGSNVIQIGFSSQDPELAAAVPNALLAVYLDERKAGAREQLDSTIAWVRRRIDAQRERVDAARDAADRYRETAGDVSADARTEEARSMAELGARLDETARSRAETATAISALETGSDEALGGIEVPDGIGALQRDLRVQNKELEKLLQTYGERADEVVALRAAMLKTRTDLDFEIDRYLQAQRARLTTFDRQESALKSALAEARARLSRSAAAQDELTRLLNGADAEQATLDKLERQARALSAQAALPAVEAEVLSAAAVPLQPQGRGRLFYLLGAMLASVFLAVTAAFVREMLDRSVRSHEQLQGIAAIAPAGLLPRLGRRAARNLPATLGGGGAFAEAVRATAMALRRANGGKLPGSVVVTSARGGKGGTLVAHALAIELAAAGQDVLLVDCDLTGGNPGPLLKSGAKPGVSEFLAGEATFDEVVHRHGVGLDFIPRGAIRPNERPRLAGMAEIVKLAKASGRFLILDSSPVLRSTDAAYLAEMAGLTLLVARWGRTSRHAVEAAAERLAAFSASPILVAVNDVDVDKHALYGFKDSELFSRR